MFDPEDFFKFAQELKTASSIYDEAKQRTIMGRLYYASFLQVRELIRNEMKNTPEELHFDELSESPYIHTVVEEIVNLLDSFTRSLLFKLKKNRQSADYKLQIGGLGIPPMVNASFRLASRFYQQIPMLSASFPLNMPVVQKRVNDWYKKEQQRKQQ